MKLKKVKTEEVEGYINLVDVDKLDVALIRKVFKPLFSPYLLETIKEPYNIKANLDIRLVFELKKEFYDLVFEKFSFIQLLKKLGQDKFQQASIYLDKGKINEIIRSCPSDLFVEIMDKFVVPLNHMLDIKVQLVNDNIYIRGNYLKFSRDLGQSPWEINGIKVCESVAEEIKKHLINLFECEDCIMSAGGREDRDVRMLGSGRPFILEIINPRKTVKPLEDVAALQELINSGTTMIAIKNLAVCDRDYYAVLKKYEDSKQKYYTCLVWTSKVLSEDDLKMLNNIQDMTIIQKTPIRVMHRRVLLDRKKTILKLECSQVNENFIVRFF